MLPLLVLSCSLPSSIEDLFAASSFPATNNVPLSAASETLPEELGAGVGGSASASAAASALAGRCTPKAASDSGAIPPVSSA